MPALQRVRDESPGDTQRRRHNLAPSSLWVLPRDFRVARDVVHFTADAVRHGAREDPQPRVERKEKRRATDAAGPAGRGVARHPWVRSHVPGEHLRPRSLLAKSSSHHGAISEPARPGLCYPSGLRERNRRPAYGEHTSVRRPNCETNPCQTKTPNHQRLLHIFGSHWRMKKNCWPSALCCAEV